MSRQYASSVSFLLSTGHFEAGLSGVYLGGTSIVPAHHYTAIDICKDAS